MKGARKEAYKKLNRKITDFGWGWPGQVPASEKVSRELKDGKDLLCVDPKKSPQAKGAAGTNAPKQATPAGRSVAGSVVEGERWVKLQREAVARSFRALDFLKKSLDVF